VPIPWCLACAVNGLFARAVLAFLALPGIVAFAIPLWMLRRPAGEFNPTGMLLAVAGTLILLSCIRDFYVAGKGTLAPWSPPKSVVTVGLYRFSRNPMYVGVLTILFGWAVLFESHAHAQYAALMMFVFYVRVVLFEEPWLARTHGDAWHAYRVQMRRRFLW
jgi:protein-S-isoprenylcysteine O-methyltransferase Ste14